MPVTDAHLTVWQYLGFPVLFLTMWLSMTALLALASGWPALARQFRAVGPPPGLRLRGQVSRVGGVPERNVTGLVVGEAGLYLWTVWPFRLLRPPLLIPWAVVKVVGERKILWSTNFAIAVGAGVEIVITQKAFDAIRPLLPVHAQLA